MRPFFSYQCGPTIAQQRNRLRKTYSVSSEECRVGRALCAWAASLGATPLRGRTPGGEAQAHLGVPQAHLGTSIGSILGD